MPQFLTVEKFLERTRGAQGVIVDVRSESEFVDGHIPHDDCVALIMMTRQSRQVSLVRFLHGKVYNARRLKSRTRKFIRPAPLQAQLQPLILRPDFS